MLFSLRIRHWPQMIGLVFNPHFPLSLIRFAALCVCCVWVCAYLKSFTPLSLHAPADEHEGQLVRGHSPSFPHWTHASRFLHGRVGSKLAAS